MTNTLLGLSVIYLVTAISLSHAIQLFMPLLLFVLASSSVIDLCVPPAAPGQLCLIKKAGTHLCRHMDYHVSIKSSMNFMELQFEFKFSFYY